MAFSKKVNTLPLMPQSHWETLGISEEVIFFVWERSQTQELQTVELGSHFGGVQAAMVLKRRVMVSLSGDSWHCLDMLLVITTERVLLAPRGWRPGILLKHLTVHGTAPHNKEIPSLKCQ